MTGYFSQYLNGVPGTTQMSSEQAMTELSAPLYTRKWEMAAQKFRPLDAARIAVVGEQLGTQRLHPDEPGARIAALEDNRTEILSANSDLQAQVSHLYRELVQLRRYNADLVQQALARGAEVEQMRANRCIEAEQLRAQTAQLMRDNELLVQLANDQRAAHVAELAKLMASAAQTVVAPVPPAPPTKPEIPARALRFSA
jgi:hypothetical protein